jgi:putative ABC transport system substrate-binding protein
MRRREFISLLSGMVVAWPRAVMAQGAANRPLVAVLIPGTAVNYTYARSLEGLRAWLRDLGYVEGKNIVIEYRSAERNYDRLPELAAELVRLKPDVLVTSATPATLAAKQATTTIPIVMVDVGDPVGSGIVASFPHPGGNITGLTDLSLELYGKRLELLKNAFPQIRHVAFLFNPANPSYRSLLKPMEIVARSLNVGVRPYEVRLPNEFENAFSTMVERRVGAAVVTDADPMFADNLKAIAVLAEKYQLPTASGKDFAKAGGLIGYGVDHFEENRRATIFVGKILKGAEPGDLPIERAAKFQFIVNLKTANALGITILPSTMVRADEVIE